MLHLSTGNLMSPLRLVEYDHGQKYGNRSWHHQLRWRTKQIEWPFNYSLNIILFIVISDNNNL